MMAWGSTAVGGGMARSNPSMRRRTVSPDLNGSM
jgi:hypothetical protein